MGQLGFYVMLVMEDLVVIIKMQWVLVLYDDLHKICLSQSNEYSSSMLKSEKTWRT